MADFNSVVLVGRLARDPELRHAPSGDPVCTFSVATNQRYTKRDGQKARIVTFVDIDAWRRLADFCSQSLKKGRQVLVSGTLKQDRWVDAKTQQPRNLPAATWQFCPLRHSAGFPLAARLSLGRFWRSMLSCWHFL